MGISGTSKSCFGRNTKFAEMADAAEFEYPIYFSWPRAEVRVSFQPS